MSRRITVVLATITAAVLVAGCGEDESAEVGQLRWEGEPEVFQPTRLPDDRVLVGEVRNESSRSISLVADQVEVHDGAGRRLESTVRFVGSFAHGLYGAFQAPDPLPPDEQKRLGLTIMLAGGKTAPLSVAFRLDDGAEGPYTVDYGTGFLPVPARVRDEAG